MRKSRPLGSPVVPSVSVVATPAVAVAPPPPPIIVSSTLTAHQRAMRCRWPTPADLPNLEGILFGWVGRPKIVSDVRLATPHNTVYSGLDAEQLGWALVLARMFVLGLLPKPVRTPLGGSDFLFMLDMRGTTSLGERWNWKRFYVGEEGTNNARRVYLSNDTPEGWAPLASADLFFKYQRIMEPLANHWSHWLFPMAKAKDRWLVDCKTLAPPTFVVPPPFRVALDRGIAKAAAALAGFEHPEALSFDVLDWGLI